MSVRKIFLVTGANCGIGKGIASLDIDGTTVTTTTPQSLRDHFNTNSIGPVTLFQAVCPLLQASKTGNPILFTIPTMIGSIACQETLSTLFRPKLIPYSARKTALNWLIARMHFEAPGSPPSSSTPV